MPAPTPTDRLRDRFRGCLLAGGLGDALGYPVEFMPTADIVRAYGIDAPVRLAIRGPAVISDDTQMTLFSAEGVIRAAQRMRNRGLCDPIAVLRNAYLRWYATQTQSALASVPHPGWLVGERRLWVQRAPGTTCMSALRTLSVQPHRTPTVASPPNDSKGCGAVMRSAPFGLGIAERGRAFSLARDAGVLTHGHPSGYLSAAYLASVICDVARGAALPDAMKEAHALCRREPQHEELLAVLDRAVVLAAGGPPTAAQLEAVGGGWTGEEALAIAVACALTADLTSADGIKAALWRAAAHAGDSDSTASICGNLLGASVGAAGLPADWLAELELREVIERLADDLLRTMDRGQALDYGDYPPS